MENDNNNDKETAPKTKPFTQNTDLNPPVDPTQQGMSVEEIDRVREQAKVLLEKLNQELKSSDEIPSWIQRGETIVDIPPTTSSTTSSLPVSMEDVQFFHKFGFLKVSRFCNDTETKGLKQQMIDLANNWDPAKELESFGTNQKENEARGDYFLESASKVHFFAEPHALVDSNDNENAPKLKPEYENDKISALNKAGHAMHRLPGSTFETYCKSDKVRELVLSLGWKDPVVPQSMYIFKQAKIGGPVTSHQDSTFLYTTPKQTCLGLWLALDPATLANGCLWVRPKSHWESTRRQYKRNQVHFGQGSIASRSNVVCGDTTVPKFIMQDLVKDHDIKWDGSLPKGDNNDNDNEKSHDALFRAGFIPIECEPGDLLAFPGELDHLSLSNYSNEPRHTFQLHLVEGQNAQIHWSESNWLQYPPNVPFLRLRND